MKIDYDDSGNFILHIHPYYKIFYSNVTPRINSIVGSNFRRGKAYPVFYKGKHITNANYLTDGGGWTFNQETQSIKGSILTYPESGGVCHYFIKNGQAEFSSDSTYLTGQTVDLEDMEAKIKLWQ